MPGQFRIVGLICLLAVAPARSQLPEVAVGLVFDGPQSRTVLDEAALRAEIEALLAGEYRLALGGQAVRHADWTIEGSRRALDNFFADDRVSIVITFGVLSTQAAADYPSLPKPVIGVVVADAALQNFPIAGASSGKRNFVYLTNFRSVDSHLEAFARAVSFKRLAVLVDEATLEALPLLTEAKARQLSELIGAEVVAVPIGASLDPVIARLDEFDAVYVTPLLRFGEAGIRRLAGALEERRIPSMSLLGGQELDWGLLMSLGGGERESTILARRIALNVQRIVLGEDPADIPVAVDYSERLTINLAVARAIGYEPTYAVQADARLINEPEDRSRERIGFDEALIQAASRNRSLRVAAYGPDLAGTDVDARRAQLLPQLGFEAARTQIDEDRANPLIQPERSSDLSLTGRQIVYSDDRAAAYRAARYGLDASVLDYDSAELDVIRDAGTAYLQVLRAEALLAVRESNLESTRENLQLARVREAIGFSGRSDLLRWQSRLATDRRDVIDAEASLRQAEVGFGRVLGVSQQRPPLPVADTLDSTLTFFTSERFAALIDTPSSWRRLRGFIVAEALEQAPEIAALDARIGAQDRLRLAARRKYYVPEVELLAGAGRRIDASGAGSGTSLPGQDDESFNVALRATWPVFTSGALRSRLDAENYRLRQLNAQREALEEQVEARMRNALHSVGASYAGIELSESAARAADQNFGIVADAYAQGAASITDLLEAQDASLAAALGAADARYAYLIDLVAVLRATGSFRLVLEPDYRDAFLREARMFIDSSRSDAGGRDAE